MNGHAPTERLFIGGDTSPGALHDLGDRLALFGRILAIEHPAPKPADRPFVFVEFAPVDPQAVHKCIAAVRGQPTPCVCFRNHLPQLNGTAWRGRTLRIERARPAYLDRLRLEWEEEASNSDPTPPLPSVTFPLRLPRLRKRHKARLPPCYHMLLTQLVCYRWWSLSNRVQAPKRLHLHCPSRRSLSIRPG